MRFEPAALSAWLRAKLKESGKAGELAQMEKTRRNAFEAFGDTTAAWTKWWGEVLLPNRNLRRRRRAAMDLPEQFRRIREWLLDDLEIAPRWEWLAWDVADMEDTRFWDIQLPHYQGRISFGRLIDDRREAHESHVLQAKLIFLRATFGPIRKMLRGKDIQVPRSAVTFHEEIKKQYGCEPGEYFVGSKDMLARSRACEDRGDRQELELWRAALVYGAARSLQRLAETAWSKPEKPRGQIRIVEG